MNKLLSKNYFLFILIGLITLSLIFGSLILVKSFYSTKYPTNTPTPNQNPEGAFCGGIAGIKCPNGYQCQLDGNYPDAGGKCTRNSKIKSTNKVICGGWDTSGEIICKCSGNLTKSSCPTGAICDSETYFCDGTCGTCCYKGIAVNRSYPPCN